MKQTLSVIAVTVAVGLSLLVGAYRLASRVSDAALDSAAANVRERFRDGDLIIVEPWPQIGPRLRLGDLPLIEPKALHPDQVAAYRRVHLIELDVIGATGESRRMLAGLGTIEARADWPGISVTRFALRSPARAVFDLRRDIEELSVVADYPDGTSEPCATLRRDRWLCPRNPDWSYVGREVRDIGNEPRECVWLHPLPRGGVLHVDLPARAVAGSPGAFLLGGFGFTDHAAGAAQAPVRVQLHSGDRILLDAVHPVIPGWQPYRVDVTPGHEPVRIDIRSENNGVGHFCFALALMEPLP